MFNEGNKMTHPAIDKMIDKANAWFVADNSDYDEDLMDAAFGALPEIRALISENERMKKRLNELEPVDSPETIKIINEGWM